jgi:hypothetical protein
MRRMRICIYGETDLQGTFPAFISALAYKILDSLSTVSITGGFRRSNKDPRATSTDVAALWGARRAADEQGKHLKDCYEARIPEPDLNGRRDVKGVVRMTEADGISVHTMRGRTSLGRRLAMVAGVDVCASSKFRFEDNEFI